MAWLLIITSVIVTWIASLCKILLESPKPSKNSFLDTSIDGVPHKRNVLLVIAHPDDESMFFSPTINYLTSRGHKLHILCLSIGDADGKGFVRKKELYQACANLKVPPQQVKILDHPDLQVLPNLKSRMVSGKSGTITCWPKLLKQKLPIITFTLLLLLIRTVFLATVIIVMCIMVFASC